MLIEPHECMNPECHKLTSNPKYCGQSCSAKCTNQLHPKRRKISPECFVCGIVYVKTMGSHGYCSELCKQEAIKDRLKEALVENSSFSYAWVKKSLVRVDWLKLQCSRCGITRWQGEPAPIHMDHKNGTKTDHRLENLRMLCMNCHGLTKTYCRQKNSKTLKTD